jgi:hypothetical protein
MTAGLVGADPDQLDQAAGELRALSARFTASRFTLDSAVQRTGWLGRDADEFRAAWASQHSRSLAEAADYLTGASDVLIRNAADQRAVSAAGAAPDGSVPESSAPTPSPPVAESSIKGALEAIQKWVESLGLPVGAANDLMETLRKMLDNGELKADWAIDLARNDGLATAFKAMDKAFDVGSLFMDFVGDIIDHPELPWDERLVHSLADTGLAFGVDQGIDKGMQWAGGALGSVIPGAGTAAGAAIGWVLGQAGSWVFDALNEKFEITETGADGILKAYQYAKEHNFDTGSIATDLARTAAHAGVQAAENLANKTVDLGADAAHGVGKFVSDHWHW